MAKHYHKNPRQITKKEYAELADSLRRLGDLSGIVHDLTTDEIIGGNQRMDIFDLKTAQVEISERFDQPDDQGTVARGFVVWLGHRYTYRAVMWDDKTREEANIRANKAGGSWDFDTLANKWDLPDLLEWGFSEKELGLGNEKEETTEDGDDEEEHSRGDVPDALWPSDNDWGIPLLDMNLQATALDLPFVGWGTITRKARMPGTWHFYTEDYRFNNLWNDPTPILNSRCVNVVEPNFSCYSQMARAWVLFQTYRKRWLARYWQSYGVRVLVDLNVAETFYDLNLLGVPKGWKAWATRGYTERIDSTEREYQMALDHAGAPSILFVVYGGGRKVKEACQSNGWLWFEEQQSIGTRKGGNDG